MNLIYLLKQTILQESKIQELQNPTNNKLEIDRILQKFSIPD